MYCSPLSAVLVSLFSVNCGQPQSEHIKWKNSRDKKFIGFKLNADLSSLMNSHTIMLCPAGDENHSLIQCIHAVCTTCPLVTW